MAPASCFIPASATLHLRTSHSHSRPSVTALYPIPSAFHGLARPRCLRPPFPHPACFPAGPRSRSPPRASATSTPDTPPPSPSALVFGRAALSQLVSLLLLILVQRAVHAGLVAANVVFPAPLAAMLLLFSVMLVVRALGASSAVDAVNATCFLPGVAFLSRWLAVFFVPNLVMLPLAPPLPRADVAKIGVVLVGGFFASLLSSAAVCAGLREVVAKVTGRPPAKVAPVLVKGAPPSNALMGGLVAVGGVALGMAWQAGSVTGYAARIYALVATVLTFCVGQRLPKSVKMLLHPLIVCTVGTIGAMALLGGVTGTSFTSTLAAYYVRNGGANWGGGNVLAALLGPAVITFAFTMDGQRRLARARLVEVVGTSLMATLGGLFGTAAVARALRMTGASRLLVVPRMITAPLAVAIAELLGANVGLAASVVALTGLLGANLGATVLTAFGVRDPVVRGLAVGASAHGLGTAAMSDEGAAFPFAALAMTLVGVFSTILVAYAPFRVLLIRVAVGKAMSKGMIVQ